jgi:hypothetical protein
MLARMLYWQLKAVTVAAVAAFVLGFMYLADHAKPLGGGCYHEPGQAASICPNPHQQ